MDNVARFSVHKNTRDQRKRHKGSRYLMNAARMATVDKQVCGYALVAWRKDGSTSIHTYHDTIEDEAVFAATASHQLRMHAESAMGYKELRQPDDE